MTARRSVVALLLALGLALAAGLGSQGRAVELRQGLEGPAKSTFRFTRRFSCQPQVPSVMHP